MYNIYFISTCLSHWEKSEAGVEGSCPPPSRLFMGGKTPHPAPSSSPPYPHPPLITNQTKISYPKHSNKTNLRLNKNKKNSLKIYFYQ